MLDVRSCPQQDADATFVCPSRGSRRRNLPTCLFDMSGHVQTCPDKTSLCPLTEAPLTCPDADKWHQVIKYVHHSNKMCTYHSQSLRFLNVTFSWRQVTDVTLCFFTVSLNHKVNGRTWLARKNLKIPIIELTTVDWAYAGFRQGHKNSFMYSFLLSVYIPSVWPLIHPCAPLQLFESYRRSGVSVVSQSQ
jgi:hypothetical protein